MATDHHSRHRDIATRSHVRALAQRERLRQADRFDERARHLLDQKIEGVVEAPIGVCVCCDHGLDGAEVLGRGTIPETDIYSTACAIQNLWLAARAEGLGVGWASFYQPADLRALLGLPDRVEPMVSGVSAVLARRTLGGSTGDTIGAAVAVTEVAVCLALLVTWH